MYTYSFLLVALLSICVSLAHGEDRCTLVHLFDRIDCQPDGIADRDSCEARGCCWIPETYPPHDPDGLGVPNCFYSYDFVSYDIAHKIESESRIIMLLKRRPIVTGFSNNVDSLLVQVTGITNDTLRIQITDSKNKRFQVPEPQLNIGLIKETCTTDQVLYDAYIEGQSLVVKRRSNNQVIFSINLTKIIYADQYIAIPLQSLPASYVYGLGEHYENFTIDFNSTYKRLIFMNRDAPPERRLPAYGTHPFYLMREVEGSPLSHGVLFFNHNIGEMTLHPSKTLVYRTIGGIVDMFVFLGPNAYDVITTKNKLIGLPMMPPLWSLGFHLCRFGYKSTAHLNATLRRNQAAGVPVDVQWVDIDYADRRNDFTIDTENFGDLGDFVRQLHTEGLHFVPIVDPAVSGDEREGTYPPYDLGKSLDIFVKDPYSNDDFIGRVWNPTASVWPDFTNPLTDLYWTEMMLNFSQQIPFDGVWIDMNEPANLINGAKNKGCPDASPYDHPPYDPSVKNGHFIFKKTICMSSRHYLGLHYDLHNMYSYYESMRTWNALETIHPRKRHFILSRASVTGQQRYSFHWTGDVFSTWEDLRQSINDIQTFSLFGMPMVGTDICGFNGPTNPELCARWSSLGAFYPFSRNHNSNDAPDQDPAFLGVDVVNAAKYALNIRYQLIPYMYTLLYQSSMAGLPMIRSLTLEYPNDLAAATVQNQFLLGPNIMISPVVEPNVVQVTPYFPVGTGWIDFVSRKPLIAADAPNRRVTLPCNISEISVAMKEGTIVPTFSSPKENLMKTVRESGYTLYVAPNVTSGEATGVLFADSGDEPIEAPSSKNSYIYFKLKRHNETRYTLTSQPLKKRYTPREGQAQFKVDQIIVLNASSDKLKIMRWATLSSGDLKKNINMQYDETSKSYTLSKMSEDLNQEWTVTWGA